MTESSRFTNRELSWLDFNSRVLALADDELTPPLERAKFLAIFSQNLDEFFQVRVAGLKEVVDGGVVTLSVDGLTPDAQLALIGERVVQLARRADSLFLNTVIPLLAGSGLRFADWPELDDEDRREMTELFARRVFPVLTPLAVDPGHPFPYISNLSLSLAVMVRDPVDDERRFARVKIPPLLPRFVLLPDRERFLPLEQLIAAHLDWLFPGVEIEAHAAFRVTRNADLDLEEEDAEDLLAAIEHEVRQRRFGRAVRLEIEQGMSAEVLELLQHELDLGDLDTYVHAAPLDLTGLWSVYAADRPDLKYPLYQAMAPRRLHDDEGKPMDIFGVLRRGDVLLHHPYDSFSSTVEEFVRQASMDPRVLAIKQTLYRTNDDSSIVSSLVRAAEAGKQVVALVEVKARFDESRNIEWARRLEQAGVHVVYGIVGLKTHSKVSLVVRGEGDGVGLYCHFGTGNYHRTTARLYEDLGLLTSDPDLGSDAGELFNYLTGFGKQVEIDTLLVAPDHLRRSLLDLIANEAEYGSSGGITMKMNSLVDAEMIEAFYAASAAGVSIDLVVRGICCLRPEVAGLSEHIRVRSILGRYLEHSRVFRFANGGGPQTPVHYIGSADLMPRNLDRRVETLVPVRDPALAGRIDEILEINLADDTLAWELHDDRWSRVSRVGTVDTHVALQERAKARNGDVARP